MTDSFIETLESIFYFYRLTGDTKYQVNKAVV